MRTVTFKNVLHGVATLAGLEPTGNLLENQAAEYSEYINVRTREAWEKFDWPELCLIEQRAYKDAWSSATSYVVGNQIFNATDSKYYQCILNHSNQQPPNTTYWTELTSFDRYVPYEQTGKTKLGDILNVWEKNPRTNRAPIAVSYELSENGVQVSLDAPAQVYVKFRKRPNQFTSTAWVSGNYAVDDIVYYPTTGECYICIAAATTQVPTDTAKWTKIDFPYVLASYVKFAAFADVLGENEQYEKEGRQMQKAEDLLMNEFDKLSLQQKQWSGYSVRTS